MGDYDDVPVMVGDIPITVRVGRVRSGRPTRVDEDDIGIDPDDPDSPGASRIQAERIRKRCPVTTERGYEPYRPCAIADDLSDCDLAGITAGCVFRG